MTFFESILQLNVLWHLAIALVGVVLFVFFYKRGKRLDKINQKRTLKGKPTLTMETLRRQFTTVAILYAVFAATISPLLIRFFERMGWY